MSFMDNLDIKEVSRKLSNRGYAFYFVSQKGYPGEQEEQGYNENPEGSKTRKGRSRKAERQA